MEYTGTEGRECVRFEIPGATVSYKKKALIFSKDKHVEEFCPVIDMSRGGVRFLSQNSIKINTKLILEIALPGETIPLIQTGIVRWSSFHVGKSYKYQIGVQFDPYGEKKGQNYPGNLTKIIALEQKFVPSQKEEEKKTEEFDIKE